MKQLKVLLINPNFKYFPGWLENVLNYRELPLGLAYIASYIRKNCPVDVGICDASLLNFSEHEVINYIIDFKPDVVGITTHTPTITFARNIAARLKVILPETFIILGGPHVTVLPFENLDVADICVSGEGEETFAAIINSLSEGLPLDKVYGISFMKDQQCFHSEDRKFIADLDLLPFPARDLFPKHRCLHIYPYRLKTPYYHTIMTSRGCAFNCNFCLNDFIWKKKVRYRSMDNVFAEIDELVNKYNTSLLFIRDDNFTLDTKRVLNFCRTKRKIFPDLKWICHARADSLHFDLLKEMKASGCVEIQIGVESGDDRILEICNKGTDTSVIKNVAQMLKKLKINFWATFIIGNEDDSEESIVKTIEFSRKIDPTYATFLFLSPFPGTKCFDNFSNKGYIRTKDWSRYNFHSEPVFETERLPRYLLMDLRKRAYRKFYLRPGVLLRYFLAFIVSQQWKVMFSNFLVVLKFVLGLIKKYSVDFCFRKNIKLLETSKNHAIRLSLDIRT